MEFYEIPPETQRHVFWDCSSDDAISDITFSTSLSFYSQDNKI